MGTALISDLHLGAGGRSDVLRSPAVLERLLERIGDCERLVLLGDSVELREHPIAAALGEAGPFFERIGEAFAGQEVVLVPGNHDHRLLGHWIERRVDDERRDEGDGFALDTVVSDPHPAVGELRSILGDARLELRYPGVWVRDDVYATHGHYLDSHLTLPTIERLSVAVVDRLGGRATGRRATPEDYERRHAPVYDLLFDLAQGARRPSSERSSPSMRLWELMGGANGRARTIRGKLLRSTVVPAVLKGLEGFGLGRFGRDFSLDEIGRAGVSAMHEVIARLEIEADHVIFGHIHRAGALPGEDGSHASHPEWRLGPTTVWNTGNWQWRASMAMDGAHASPFWPGRAIIVGEEGPPELIGVLDDLDSAALKELVKA